MVTKTAVAKPVVRLAAPDIAARSPLRVIFVQPPAARVMNARKFNDSRERASGSLIRRSSEGYGMKKIRFGMFLSRNG
ncbi:hypothetical protein AD997_04490 [Erwinia amylovora]|nr:hypothetical protein AD997_04490 [Erwinia amylovora]RUT18009.1 hypothetical protein BEI72_06690 [Erwinia amylovora]